MKQLKYALGLSVAFMLFFTSCFNNEGKKYENAEDIPVNKEMIAELTSPPHVPTPVGKRKAKKLIVKMEILEKEGEMTDGVKYVYWTFGGTVPGSFIRTRVGDEVE
ncbi:MAG TPA: nitrite reductase, copper-containing, partial [Mariniflexile sp.]|nr:nitrite reductase, copper-containing [Mariniflexile sp.]